MRPSRRDLVSGAAVAALSACASAPPRRADVIGDLDGVGLAAKIRSREIAPLEAIEAAIARAELLNPQLNFIATKAYEYARARAPADPIGPFAGVPTFIKDLTPLAGVRFMEGSRAYAQRIAQRHDSYVDALLRAGLVPIGKSTTPEFGLTCTTEPLVTGQTKNPWDVSRIAGGSSGGAAAAVAAGVVPVAHASDGGGSIRAPASICGLVGLKVSRDRSVRDPLPDASPIVTGVQGCLSRTVRDTAAWFAATEQRRAGAAYAPHGLVPGPSSRRLRIGVMINDAAGVAPDAVVRDAIEDVARLCQRLGHEVGETQMGMDGNAYRDAFIAYWAAGAAQDAAAAIAANPGRAPEDILEPLTLQLTERARAARRGALQRAISVLLSANAAYARLFAAYHVVLTPVTAKPPLALGEIAPTLPFDVGFARVQQYVRYTPLVNTSGGCAISLPLAWTEDNLPLGAHFMAAPGDERTLLELAYELEIARPWAQRRPPFWAG